MVAGHMCTQDRDVESLPPVALEAARTALEVTGLGPSELWTQYLIMGGRLSAAALRQGLATGRLPVREFDRLAVALNDELIDAHSAYRVPYLDGNEPDHS